jgi:signal transduction histidine kinase/ActR/RegA family two-component response regulator
MERLATIFRALADRLDDAKDAPSELRREGRRALRRVRGGEEDDAAKRDLAAQRSWLDEALAAGSVILDGARYPVRSEARWRAEGEGYRVVLALFDERVLLSHIEGVVPAERVEVVAACFEAVREELHAVQGHVCDLRGVRGVGLAPIRAALRAFPLSKIRWLRRTVHLTPPELDVVVRIFEQIYRSGVEVSIGGSSLETTLRHILRGVRVVEAPDPLLSVARYREAIGAAMERMVHIALDADVPLSPPPWADALVRELYLTLSLVRDDVSQLKRSLQRANEGLEAQVAERTDDIARARARAETLAAEKQRLLSAMSHEVRTPLHGITAAVSLLADTPLNEEQRDLLGVLSGSALHLGALVDDLMDWSVADHGARELALTPGDLGALVTEVVDALRERATSRGVDLRADVQATPVLVSASRLRQALFTLVDNAVKFSAGTPVDVRVDLLDPGAARVTVRDQGVGIRPEHLADVFEPFSAASRETASRYGGTGIRLAVARRIVDAHHGTLTVESEPSRGTAFTLTLPLREPGAPSVRPTERSDALAGMRVLVTEDNQVVQRVAARMLRRWGVHVSVADDGAQCLDALTRDVFDAVLLDLQMPVLDGFEALARIRRHPDPAVWALPVIALTADVCPEARSRAMSLGASAFATKPYRPEALFAMLAAQRGGDVRRSSVRPKLSPR